LKVLHIAFVLLGFFARREGSEVAVLAGFGVGFLGVEAVLAGLQFANHALKDAAGCVG
jgi:hypothetical protein